MPTTNSINNACSNNFLVKNTNSGVPVTYTIQETSNSASATAYKLISSAGSSSGNPFVRWAVGNTSSFSLGVVNGVSPVLSLNSAASGAVPGSGVQVMSINTSGNVGFPANTAVYATSTAGQPNATGNGTTVTVKYGSAPVNIGSGYDTSTGIFTAPANGKYHFTFACGIYNWSAGMTTTKMNIITTQHTSTRSYCNWYGTSYSGYPVSYCGSCIALLDIGDTAYVTIAVSGGTKTATVYGTAAGYGNLSYFTCDYLG
jgi:hypothetical protein